MYNWVIDGFHRKGLKAGVDYMVIDGQVLTGGLETGEVLDAEGTNFYKASQLMEICRLFKNGSIHDGDIFFIADLWFPGIEMIRYIEAQKGMKVRIAGIHYAGVFDPFDFVNKMNWWAKYNEAGWLILADWVFVGSRYHQKLIEDGMSQTFNSVPNIVATGLVWDSDKIKSDITKKERTVIFPHRTDKEKNPEDFFKLAERIRKEDPTVKFVITSSRKKLASNIVGFKVPDYIELKVGLTKQEYYDELAKAKVLFSSAYQETFGYALNEGLKLKCFPVCPRRCSYPEVVDFDDRCLYDNFEEAVGKTIEALNSKWDVSSYTEKYSKSIDKMLNVMEG
jgi:glycosyltransferase involved in cell wall biosynthesis